MGGIFFSPEHGESFKGMGSYGDFKAVNKIQELQEREDTSSTHDQKEQLVNTLKLFKKIISGQESQ